jgi:VanZ family protein
MERQSALRILSRYLPLVAWLVFISVASSDSFSANNTSRILEPFIRWLFPGTSAAQLALIQLLVRKASHLTEYAILGFLAFRAFSTSPQPALKRNWFLASLILVTAYALLDEYHQSFVPSRTASIFDSLIDAAGGLTALLIARFRKRSREPQQFESSRV